MIGTVRDHVRERVDGLTNPVFIKQMIWVLVFFVLMLVTLRASIVFMETRYPDQVRPDDLILDLVPDMPIFILLSEAALFITFSLMFYGLWQGRFQQMPRLFFLLIMMYFLRALIIPLTPLAQIKSPDEYYAEMHLIATYFYQGMYFSGHTATVCILAAFFKAPRLRITFTVLAAVQIISLLLSHAHYSIDIVGGLFAAYFVVTFDFMKLVPRGLRDNPWMPWVTDNPLQPAPNPSR